MKQKFVPLFIALSFVLFIAISPHIARADTCAAPNYCVYNNVTGTYTASPTCSQDWSLTVNDTNVGTIEPACVIPGTWTEPACPTACGLSASNQDWTCEGGNQVCSPSTHAQKYCAATTPCGCSYSGDIGWGSCDATGVTIDIVSGATFTVNDQTAGYTGAVTYLCTNGSFSVSGFATCTQDPTGTWTEPSCPTACGSLASNQDWTCTGGNGVCSPSTHAQKPCLATGACPYWGAAPACATACGTLSNYTSYGACSTGTNSDCSGAQPTRSCLATGACPTWGAAPACDTITCGQLAYTSYGACSTGTNSDCSGAQPTRSCTATADCPLNDCATPLTKNVTVACDAVAGNSVTGSVTRSQSKSAYPTCTFPAAPVTTSNSTYVSDTCVYTCNNGANNPTTCTTFTINGSCSTTADTCTTGTYSSSPADTTTEYKWTCLGAGTPVGTDSGTCTAPKDSNSCSAPLTQNVTVSCDTFSGTSVTGSVTRSQDKSAYPDCTFPANPVTSSNSTYVSDTCNWTCDNGANNPNTCNAFTVTPSAASGGTITPNTPQSVTSGGTISFIVTATNPTTHYVSVGGTCGGTLVGNTYTTNAITSNCTVTATFPLGGCTPATQDVDVACDVISGNTATGKLVRTQTAGSYPSCTFPTVSIADPIKSNTCVWTCDNTSEFPTTCLGASVGSATVTANHTDHGIISYICSNATKYTISRDGNVIVPMTPYTGVISIDTFDYSSTAGNYSVSCWSGSMTPDTRAISYDPTPLVTDSVILNATPRTTKSGTVTTLTWSINNPVPTCTLTAHTVCNENTCSLARTNDADALTALFSSGNTDANDPYGSRTINESLTTVATTLGTKALGKKSIKINYTTDFLIDCHLSAPKVNPTKKIRVQVTNDNEG